MIIYITGIDGSGKSTLAKHLVQSIFREKDAKIIWARYQPNIVKKLLFPFKKNFVTDKANDHLMNAEEFSRWTSFKRNVTKNPLISRIIYFLQAFDYYLQILRVSKSLRYQDITILDRYILDFIVDQSANYGNLSKRLITKFLLNKLAMINFVIYVDVNEHIAFSRKNDIPSIEYFQNKREYYKYYITQLSNGYIINNDNDISIAVDKIKEIISG